MRTREIYIAYDGKEFNKKEECLRYEETNDNINNLLKNNVFLYDIDFNMLEFKNSVDLSSVMYNAEYAYIKNEDVIPILETKIISNPFKKSGIYYSYYWDWFCLEDEQSKINNIVKHIKGE